MIWYPCNYRGGIKTANNLVVTEEGFALDARQGKVLNEKIAETIGKILLPYGGVMPNDADFNDYKTRGWYLNNGTNTNQTNIPYTPDNGILIVLSASLGNVPALGIRHIWIGLFSTAFKTRAYINGTWTEWKSFALE